MSSKGDLFGTAINVASRLEGIAELGGIVVSAAVRDAIAGRLVASFTDLGQKDLKNIAEPLRAYALLPCASPGPSEASRRGESLPLPDKPSIAVLPFDNMSGDRDQEYFADGMVEEIITALSRMRWLFVIARNSSFAYKGRAIDVKQIGRELGVRYILEGSVRKAGSKVRITGQLIDTATGAHLWAERFDGSLEDIFDLQDQVTSNVVGAIAPKLEQAEINRAKRKPTESLDAYDFYLRGLALTNTGSRETSDQALEMFARARERDPDFVPAYAQAAFCYTLRNTNGWMVDREQETAEATTLARRAVDMGRDDAVALCHGGITLAYVAGDMEDGFAFVGRALTFDANLAAAWFANGWLKLCQGDIDAAVNQTQRAMRLSPLDPTVYVWETDIALARFCAGSYSEAASLAESVLRRHPTYTFALRVLSASQAMSGHLQEAHRAMTRLLQADPQLRLSNLENVISPLQPEHLARYIEGLRLAGLPD